MSLISPKHLVGPFTNKVHLGTILALSLAFLLFRLFGGTIQRKPVYQERMNTVSSSRQAAATEQARPRPESYRFVDPDEELEPAPEVKEQPAPKPSRPSLAASDDSIGGLLSGGHKAGKSSGKPAAPTPATGRSLEDIEKSLGLR